MSRHLLEFLAEFVLNATAWGGYGELQVEVIKFLRRYNLTSDMRSNDCLEECEGREEAIGWMYGGTNGKEGKFNSRKEAPIAPQDWIVCKGSLVL